MATIDIQVPDIGDFAEVGVIEILVQPGERVALEQSLITVESDKASMEIPSSHAGVVRELKVALGDQIREGSLILMLETADAASAGTSNAPVTGAACAGVAWVSGALEAETSAAAALAASF